MNEGPDVRTYGIIPLSSEGEKNLKNLPLPLVTELALIPIQEKITYDFLFIILIQPNN